MPKAHERGAYITSPFLRALVPSIRARTPCIDISFPPPLPCKVRPGFSCGSETSTYRFRRPDTFDRPIAFPPLLFPLRSLGNFSDGLVGGIPVSWSFLIRRTFKSSPGQWRFAALFAYRIDACAYIVRAVALGSSADRMGSAAFSFPTRRAVYAALPRATAAASDSVAGGVFRRGARR